MNSKHAPGLAHRLKNKEELARAISEQILLNGNFDAARNFANCAEIINLKPNKEFMTQGADDNDLYFILKGNVAIEVNQRRIAIRNAGEHIGEMAVLDKTASRSATGKTTSSTVLAKISEPDFTKIANKYPIIWRRAASTLAKRLSERMKFHNPPRSKPVIFIGSSKEGESIAKVVFNYLRKEKAFVPHLWSDNIFTYSKTPIEELIKIAKEVDFAVLLCTPDDFLKSRGEVKAVPRDNIIFEAGLFMGAITRERTVLMTPLNREIKLPTDLLGITILDYEIKRNKSYAKSLLPSNKKIKKMVNKFGPI